MLVRESLYNFKRESDPIQSSGLGIISLIEKWLKECNIENYIINDDYSIDVDDVYISNKNISKLPEYIKFDKVKGGFVCSNNQLTSLIGCPKSIGGSFYCFNNRLTSLKGCPTIVVDAFYCANNQLTSLIGCPKSIGGSFYCFNNQLISLEGCPTKVGSDFDCSNNQKKFTKEYVRSLCDVKGGIEC